MRPFLLACAVTSSMLFVALPGRAFGQGHARGRIEVLGLRAPDGDDNVAALLTAALREAARDAGLVVNDSLPSFNQEFSMVNCESIGAECLSRIATDIRARAFVYGSVMRERRGHVTQIVIDVHTWNNDSRHEIGHEQSTLAVDQTGPEVLRELAHRVISVVLSASEQPARASTQSTGALVVTATSSFHPDVSAEPPVRTQSRALRYLGLGIFGLGVASGAFGVWQLVKSAEQGDITRNGIGAEGEAWARYDNSINQTRSLTVSQVCERAAIDAPSNPDAALAHGLCEANDTAHTAAWVLGISSVVLAGVGATMFIMDMVNGAHAEATPTPRVSLTPTLSREHAGVVMRIGF